MNELKTVSIYIAGWLPMVAIAIANGALRELWYSRYMSERSSHQLSSVCAIAAFLLYTSSLNAFVPIKSGAQAFTIGTAWLALTIPFEFIFGHYVAGHSWEKLLADYNIFKGRLWLLVLLTVFCSPAIIFHN